MVCVTDVLSASCEEVVVVDLAGQFDEKVFSGLDFVLAEAGRRGLKLILALTNYWTPFGGMAQYVK